MQMKFVTNSLESTSSKTQDTNQHDITFHSITRYNPPLQKNIEDMQGRIHFDLDTPMVPPYGRIVYDYTNPMWIPNAKCTIKLHEKTKETKQNRHTRLNIRNSRSIINTKLRH